MYRDIILKKLREEELNRAKRVERAKRVFNAAIAKSGPNGAPHTAKGAVQRKSAALRLGAAQASSNKTGRPHKGMRDWVRNQYNDARHQDKMRGVKESSNRSDELREEALDLDKREKRAGALLKAAKKGNSKSERLKQLAGSAASRELAAKRAKKYGASGTLTGSPPGSGRLPPDDVARKAIGDARNQDKMRGVKESSKTIKDMIINILVEGKIARGLSPEQRTSAREFIRKNPNQGTNYFRGIKDYQRKTAEIAARHNPKKVKKPAPKTNNKTVESKTLVSIINRKLEEKKKVNPWAVCHSSTGPEKSAKFERCVKDVKKKEGIQEMLKGGQKKLDVNKSGKLDAQDFKMLRAGKKKKDMKEDTSFASRLVDILLERNRANAIRKRAMLNTPEQRNEFKFGKGSDGGGPDGGKSQQQVDQESNQRREAHKAARGVKKSR